MICIYIPKNINFIILNNNYIYIYNNKLFFLIKIQNFNSYYNSLLNILKLNIFNLNLFSKKKFLNNFLFLWNNFLFTKIYFLGKGFKLKKIKNNIYFNFNYSHINLLINKKIILKKIQKHKILLISKNQKLNYKLSNTIKNIKKLNFYTKRGIRNAKEIIFIKKNKNNTK